MAVTPNMKYMERLDLNPPRRVVTHRSSVWTNEENNLLFQFWRRNVDKIDLPGRTEDKLKNKIYGHIQETFLKHGFKRSIKQIRKKIQNLKREAGKYKNIDLSNIDDENIRARVKAVNDIIALNDSDHQHASSRVTESHMDQDQNPLNTSVLPSSIDSVIAANQPASCSSFSSSEQCPMTSQGNP